MPDKGDDENVISSRRCIQQEPILEVDEDEEEDHKTIKLFVAQQVAGLQGDESAQPEISSFLDVSQIMEEENPIKNKSVVR